METRTITLDGHNVPVSYTDTGAGGALLLLHGGGGPMTVAGFGDRFAAERQTRVLVPRHPGFDGTPRPDQITTIRDLARLYTALLAELDLYDVTVVGNSIGGWIAAEIAVLADPRVSRVVLVDAVGLALAEAPIVDFFGLTMDQVYDLSYADPDAFRMDLAALPAQQQAVMAANRETLRVYGGTSMADPTLLDRLPEAKANALVVWGAADRIVTATHGHAYAAALPHARFALIENAGHLPQLETPETLADLITGFTAGG
jgi:pimeloyl-ACP methyl ester carboxylesterase